MKKIWWQVYTVNRTAYGFATINDIVVDAPDYSWKNRTISSLKPLHFTKDKILQIVKICEQCI